MKVKSLSHVRLFATTLTVTYQAPPSMGFSRQEYWSGLPFPSPGDLPVSTMIAISIAVAIPFFPSQASEFPLLFPYILDSSFNSLLCQLGDRYTVLYLKSSVTTANSETSCISKCFLVKEDKSPPSTFFLEIL